MTVRRCALLGLCLALVSGCAATQVHLEKALLAGVGTHSRDLEAHYRVRCPDVLQVHIEGRFAELARVPVSVDGCIHLPDLVVRVDGLTAPEIAREVARRVRAPDDRVFVHVAEHRSQHLYLFGEVNADHQVVPYLGPETIIDLLRRVGGAAPNAALGDVRVVRAHIADGRPPEVFHVDLEAILLRRDGSTNVCLEPFDRVYVGQTRRSRVATCLPPCLRPFYCMLWGMK